MVYSTRKAPAVSKDLEELAFWAEDEFDNIQLTFSETELLVNNVVPAKPIQGLLAYADGTNWNPGAGEGPYYYTSGGVWLPAFSRQDPTTEYYVLAGGSNANDGKTNTVGGAWATLQHAVDVLQGIALPRSSINVNVGPGTYAGFVVSKPFTGALVTFIGDITTPSNCLVSPAAGSDGLATLFAGSSVHVKGFKVVTSAGGIGCSADTASSLFIDGKMDFGVCTNHIVAVRGGSITIGNSVSYNITGGANFHMNAISQGRIIANVGTTTLTGTPAFATAFVGASANGLVQSIAETFSGAATGTRAIASNGGGIDTQGSGGTYFPGNAAVSVTAPGWYS